MTWLRGTLTERRRRALASDARAGSWARGRARTVQREFLREHWKLFGCFVVGVWAIAILCGMTMPNAFMNGLVVGAGLVTSPAAVWVFTVQITGSAPVMMGDQAEQWTAQELRRLRRAGWLVINHFVLGTDDIDHVLLGPGGAFVLETKWSGSPWDSGFGRQRQRDAIIQAATNARSLRLWHPFKSRDIPVRPVVVLWGRGLSKWPKEHQVREIGSATVVTGPALRAWAGQLGGARMTRSEVEQAWEALETQVARRDPLDMAKHPLPTSLAEWATRAGVAVFTGVASLWVFTLILRLTNSALLGIALSAVLAVPGPLLSGRRLPPWLLWAAWAWSCVLIGLSVALAIAEVVYRTR